MILVDALKVEVCERQRRSMSSALQPHIPVLYSTHMVHTRLDPGTLRLVARSNTNPLRTG
jgi:hypothetical protein